MKARYAIRIGALLVTALAVAAAWALVTASEGQPLMVTVDPTGTYDRYGIATVSGSVVCATPSTVYLSGTLQEAVGRKGGVSGSFAINFGCEPGMPVAWSAPVAPTTGKFGGGQAILANAAYTAWFRFMDVGYPGPEYTNCGAWADGTWLCRNDGTFGPEVLKLTKSH